MTTSARSNRLAAVAGGVLAVLLVWTVSYEIADARRFGGGARMMQRGGAGAFGGFHGMRGRMGGFDRGMSMTRPRGMETTRPQTMSTRPGGASMTRPGLAGTGAAGTGSGSSYTLNADKRDEIRDRRDDRREY